jgi:hypothetical protein
MAGRQEPEREVESVWRLGPPDPSTLTTAQLVRELNSLKELLTVRIGAVEKAQEKFEENISRVPTEVDRGVKTLRELLEVMLDTEKQERTIQSALMDEKFAGVQTQFDLLDRSTREKAELADKALSAALSAQKEAAQKTETALTKLIDGQADTVQTLGDTLNDKLNTLKDVQNITQGKSGGQTAVWGWVVGIAGILVALLGVAAVIGVSLFESRAK